MSNITPKTYYPGETIRVWASDLTHLDHGPITSGATVTFAVVDLAGNTQAGGGEGTASNDDWYIDITTPATPGQYRVLVTAVAHGDTWKGALPFAVGAHQ
jgi:hypothetical protein